jgi:hypothetical protein
VIPAIPATHAINATPVTNAIRVIPATLAIPVNQNVIHVIHVVIVMTRVNVNLTHALHVNRILVTPVTPVVANVI